VRSDAAARDQRRADTSGRSTTTRMGGQRLFWEDFPPLLACASSLSAPVIYLNCDSPSPQPPPFPSPSSQLWMAWCTLNILEILTRG